MSSENRPNLPSDRGAHRSVRALRHWLAALLLGPLLLLLGREAWAGGRHPQDGPHVDLRYELRADALVADISMNLVFLDEILPSEREQSDRLSLGELRTMEPRLLARMAEVAPVSADGRRLTPSIEGLAMNDPDEALLPLFPISGMRGLRKIKFELVYPVAEEPSSLSIVWHAYPIDLLSAFDPKPPLVIAAELTAQGVRSQLTFTSTEPEFVWHALRGGLDARLSAVPAPAARRATTVSWIGVGMLLGGLLLGARSLSAERRARLPRAILLVMIGAVCTPWLPVGRSAVPRWLDPFGATSALPSEDEARAIFEPLHVNLYRAFDFADESAIYDALARSVDGPLLETLYLTIHRSLVMHEEGGAMSRVRDVRRLGVAVDSVGLVPSTIGQAASPAAAPSDGAREVASFLVTCRYQVDGRVTHWGHSHDRTNEYVARYTVVARESGWRIAEAEVLSQSRVDAAPAEGPGMPQPGPDGLLDL